ncbi:MAG: WD40 repeat domain-containing protein, partial [Planctomycetota bacterium]|jgi:WD40 repeat protein
MVRELSATEELLGEGTLALSKDGKMRKLARELSATEELLGECTLALSKDGKMLASAHYEKLVLWEMPSGRPLRIIRGERIHYGGRTHGLAISPDGKTLASKARDSTVRLWEIATGKPLLPQEETHKDAVIAVDCSRDGRLVVTGSADATIRLWDATTGEHVRQISRGSGWARFVSFSPRGRTIAIGAETYERGDPKFRGEVKICRTATGEVLQHFETPDRVVSAVQSPDGKLLAAAVGLGRFGLGEKTECKIYVWELETGEKLAELGGHTQRILQVAFSRDGKFLVSVSDDGTVRRWNLAGGREQEEFKIPVRFHRAAFSPGAMTVVTGSTGYVRRPEAKTYSGKITVWDLVTKKPRLTIQTPEKYPYALAISPIGDVLAAYLRPNSRSDKPFDDRIVLWDMTTGRELLNFKLDDGSVRSLAFSPNGRRLISGMDRGDALVWDVSAAYEKVEP